MKKCHLPVILWILVLPFTATAQTDSAHAKPVFKMGLYYNSHLNYYGRTDSLRSSGLFPMAELWLEKHYYLNVAPIFVSNRSVQLQYAGTVATAGYFFRDTKWGVHAFVVKPIYKSNSQLVQSALKWQASANFSALNKVVNLTFGGDLKYSEQMDYGASLGLDHMFRLEPGGGIVIVLDPSAFVYGGTQQFTRTSYKKSGFLLFPGFQQEITEEVKKFTILSYEFSMPVVMAKGKFQFIANPAYVVPQHLVAVPGRPDLSERGKQMFYFTAGAKLIF